MTWLFFVWHEIRASSETEHLSFSKVVSDQPVQPLSPRENCFYNALTSSY